jgi:L-asparaginase II
MFSGILKTRQGHVEAQKPLAWVLKDSHGDKQGSVNVSTTSTYLRSVFKPVQSTVLLHYLRQQDPSFFARIPPQAWVIASASHSGEAVHQQWGQWWLNEAGITREEAEACLVCGVHPPMASAGGATPIPPNILHHNCSGQHAMMLSLAKRLTLPWHNYHLPEHPFFQETLRFMERHASSLSPDQWATDGCRLPTPYLSLEHTTDVMHGVLEDPLGHQLLTWMKEHPSLVAGSHRFDTILGQLPWPIVSKGGAEGLVVLWHLEEQQTLVIKSLAGDATARDAFAWHVLAHVGWIPLETALEHAPLMDDSPYASVQSDLQFCV